MKFLRVLERMRFLAWPCLCLYCYYWIGEAHWISIMQTQWKTDIYTAWKLPTCVPAIFLKDTLSWKKCCCINKKNFTLLLNSVLMFCCVLCLVSSRYHQYYINSVNYVTTFIFFRSKRLYRSENWYHLFSLVNSNPNAVVYLLRNTKADISWSSYCVHSWSASIFISHLKMCIASCCIMCIFLFVSLDVLELLKRTSW